MARTTFGEQLVAIMARSRISARSLSKRLHGDPDDTRLVQRLRKFDARKGEIRDSTIEDLVMALDLSYPDAMYLYGLAGKIPSTRPPSLTQIGHSLDSLVSALEEFPFPAYVLDSRHFRFWLVNAPAALLFGGTDRLKALANCSVFQLLFSSRYGLHDIAGAGLQQIQVDQVRRFKALNILRRHEEFYMEYPERLRDKDGLTPEEYALFAEIWQSVTPDGRPTANYASLADITLDFGGVRIVFRLTAETVLDLGNLFGITWFNLWSREYEDVMRMLFGGAQHQPCIKVWELPGADMSDVLG